MIHGDFPKFLMKDRKLTLWFSAKYQFLQIFFPMVLESLSISIRAIITALNLQLINCKSAYYPVF